MSCRLQLTVSEILEISSDNIKYERCQSSLEFLKSWEKPAVYPHIIKYPGQNDTAGKMCDVIDSYLQRLLLAKKETWNSLSAWWRQDFGWACGAVLLTPRDIFISLWLTHTCTALLLLFISSEVPVVSTCQVREGNRKSGRADLATEAGAKGFL